LSGIGGVDCDAQRGCVDSSLSYLHCLPINRVKIDQLFIQEILMQTRPPMIVRAIIAMAHSLNLLVLAEGFEREAQRTVLLDEG
jgi:EAL domain-containing protein (putative c-di-GMP-specific phosphodiesterase class I)